MNRLYNKWWLKWRDRASAMTEEEYDQAANEALDIMASGEEYPIIRHLVIAFLYELSARMRGEYTEAEANKLLTIIREEATA